MRKALFIFFTLFFLSSYGQEQITLKKKFFGTYAGEIPKFQLDSGNEIVDIDSSKISISISKDSISFGIGNTKRQGTYTVLFEGDNYFVLECPIDHSIVNERVVVYKRGKRISRDGLYPQPNAFLYKVD